MNLFASTKIHGFGLDISDSSIKVAQLNLENGQVSSAAFADVALLDKTIINHQILNEQRLAGNILKAVSAAKNIDGKYVVCSVPEGKSFIRILQIPKMPESEIDGAIPYELEQDIPIPVDQVYLDWQIINELPDKLELLVAASSKEYIDSLVETLRLAKLTPLAMEIGSQATARALIGPENLSKSVLVVDIGARQTSFTIVDQGNLQYTSSVPIAGNAFTESITRNLGISAGAAEKLKQPLGLLTETQQGINVRKAFLPILDNVVDEIKNVIRFFEEHSVSHRRIETVFLCGGSASVPGLVEYILARINLGSDKGKLNVTLGNQWANLSAGAGNAEVPIAGEGALRYATAIGLALHGLDYESR